MSLTRDSSPLASSPAIAFSDMQNPTAPTLDQARLEDQEAQWRDIALERLRQQYAREEAEDMKSIPNKKRPKTIEQLKMVRIWRAEDDLRERFERRVLDGEPGWYGLGFHENTQALWHGTRVVGSGGAGLAKLWDRKWNDQIIDQMVIKEVQEHSEHLREAQIMRLLQHSACINIIRFKHHNVLKKVMDFDTRPELGNFRHRFYLEFCPHGDLADLQKKYQHASNVLPEPFLWKVFYSLVRAAKIMKDGTYTKKGKYEREIVHRDLKPENVFLGAVNKGFDPFYPVVKMADFSHAAVVGKDHPGADHVATPGYEACEQFNVKEYKAIYDWLGYRDHRVIWWTNVWQIGVIMYELLRLNSRAEAAWRTHPAKVGEPDRAPGDRVARWALNNDEHGQLISPIDGPDHRYPDAYSEELTKLVYRCLEFRGEDRPALYPLFRRTRRHWRKARKAMIRATRNADISRPDVLYQGKLYYASSQIVPPDPHYNFLKIEQESRSEER